MAQPDAGLLPPVVLHAGGDAGDAHAAAGPAQVHSQYWEQAREQKTMKWRGRPPVYEAEDPPTWLRLMEQHLRLQGMADAITQEPRYDGLLLRARPSDRAGHSWDEINGRVLNALDAARFVRCTDAFTLLQSALSHAPTVVRQLAVTVEDGNAKALWDTLRAHITETRGETGARLLAKLVASRMHTGETPLEYGRRLQAELVAVRAHGRDLDEDLLKDRFVNFMTPAYAHTAELLALHRRRSTLDELIEMAGDIGAAQASIAPHRASGPKGGKQQHADAATELKKGCFKCGAHDHIKAHCPLLKGGDHGSSSSSRNDGGKDRKTCEVCQKPGHSTERCFMLERAEKVIRERKGAPSNKGHGGRPAEAQAAVQESLHHGYHVSVDISQKRLLDSAASTHMQAACLPVRRDLGVAGGESIRIASGKVLEEPRRAEVDLPLKDGSTFALRGVLTHPEMRTNLVSVGALLDDPAVDKVEFRREGAAVLDGSGDTVMTARRENGVYVVNTAHAAETQTAAAATAQLWHQRACHLSASTLADTAKAGVLEEGDQLKRKGADGRQTCEPCIMAKMTRSPFGRKVRDELRARRVLERVHLDTSGPYPEGPNGERYRVNIKDEYSGEKQVLITATKAQIAPAVVAWAKAVQNKLGVKIAELHFDGGSEFKADVERWGKQNGTATTFGPRDTPQLNGRAERAVRTIDTLQNAAMQAAGAPQRLWPYASKHAVAVCNRFMLSPNDPKRTRHQVFFDLKGPTSVSEIKVWGCRAYAHRQAEPGDTKLASKAVACSHLGYDYGRSSYTLMDDDGRIFQSRDVRFVEDSFAGMRELADDDDGAEDRPHVGSRNPEAYQPKGDMALAKLLSMQHAAPERSDERKDPEPRPNDGGPDSHSGPFDLEFRFDPEVAPPLAQSVASEEEVVVAGQLQPESEIDSDQSDAESDKPAEEPQYSVEKIVGKRTVKRGGEQYKVKWQGYAKPTWEPAATIRAQVPDFVRDYEQPSESDSEPDAPPEEEKEVQRVEAAPPQVAGQPSDASSDHARPKRAATTRGVHRLGMVDERDVANAAVLAEACVAVTDIHPDSQKLGDPQSLAEIMRRPDREQWLAAHQLEHQAHLTNGTYSVVPKSGVPKGTRLLTWKDVYKLKVGPDGKPAKYKARFTVRGCAQGPDQYGDITAFVFALRSLRVVCALVAHHDWEFKLLDVDAAYLHGDLKEELYAVAPKGLGIPEEQCVKLHKTIYGLKQAGHEWQQKIFTVLLSLGYIQLRWSDRCIFIRRLSGGRLLILMVYVDDIPYAYDRRDAAEMKRDVDALMKAFPMKDLGEAEYILGWRVTRDRANRRLTLDQQGYVQQLLEDYGMAECKASATPGTAASVLYGHSKPQESLTKELVTAAEPDMHLHPQVQVKDFRSVIGALQYLACSTAPVIADAVNKLAQFSNAPQAVHLRAVKKILRYLAGHRSDRITYTGTAKSGVPQALAYSDADYAEDYETRKSTTGWLVTLCNGAVSWRSKKQSTVARSTMEAEYVAAASLVDEVIWLRRLLSDLGCEQKGPTPIHIDNQSSIAIAKEGGKEDRRKHIDIKHHILVEAIDNRVAMVNWIPSKDNPADLFTKALPEAQFTKLKASVLGQP